MGARGSLSFLYLSACIVLLDQGCKNLIEQHLELLEAVDVLPVLQITRAHNPGAAFSFLANAAGWQRWLFTGLALVVSAALVAWLRQIGRGQRMLAAAVSLILGGAIGNVIDRIRLGHVIDFINVHWNEHYFPAFNVADSAICVGAGLLLLDTWLTSRAPAAAKRPENS